MHEIDTIRKVAATLTQLIITHPDKKDSIIQTYKECCDLVRSATSHPSTTHSAEDLKKYNTVVDDHKPF